MLLLLWCVSTKQEKYCPQERCNNKAKRGPTISNSCILIPSWTYCCLILNTQEDIKTALLASVVDSMLRCADQKPKISSSTAPRLLGGFPLVLSQSGSESQSLGVTPMSRTWGLLRDNARLRRQEEIWPDEINLKQTNTQKPLDL